MSNPKHIQDELNNLESGLPFNNSQPFSVPEGYFEGLAAAVLSKVKSSEASVDVELTGLSPLLAGIPKVTPYSVPSSYFNDNLDNATEAVLETESALLGGIGTGMPYVVPDGYFQSFPQQMLSKMSVQETKVVPLFARTWMRMAAAAVVAGIMVFAGLQIFNRSGNGDTDLADNTVDTASQQVAQNTSPVLKEVKQASTKDLEAFIENVQMKAILPTKASTNSKSQVLLSDVSVNEMESFLSDLSADDDLLTD